jgi:2-keto-myo-inositol isomerase
LELGYNEATCKELSSVDLDVMIAEKCGFTAFELRFDMIEKYLKHHSYDDLAVLFKTHSVKPVTINALFGVNFADDNWWEASEKKVDFARRIYEATGADILLALPTVGKEPCAFSAEKIADDTAEALLKLNKISGLKIAFEPLGYRNSTVRGIKVAWEIVKNINSPEIGLAVDCYNLYHFDKLRDITDLVQVDPRKIFIVHLNDAQDIPFEQLEAFNRVLPGDGVINCTAYLKALFATGYDGVISVEVLNTDLWKIPPEELIPEAYVKTAKMVQAAFGGKP